MEWNRNRPLGLILDEEEEEKNININILILYILIGFITSYTQNNHGVVKWSANQLVDVAL
jgi:hypothetical protein